MKPKAKGNSFERKIANLLSDRFKEKTGIDKSFRRNADSGSFFGGTNVKRVNVYDTDKATFGDIICPETFGFSLECKHYKTAPSFSLLVKQDVKDWDTWIKQAEQDCASSDKKLAVIIKYNNVEEIVILDVLPEGMAAVVRYKKYFVVKLSDWVALPDSYFF